MKKRRKGQRSLNKKRGPKKPTQKKKKKKKRGNVTILFPHLRVRVPPCSSYRESLELSLSYTSGNFIIELGLYIPMMGFLKCPRSS